MPKWHRALFKNHKGLQNLDLQQKKALQELKKDVAQHPDIISFYQALDEFDALDYKIRQENLRATIETK